VSRGEKKGDYFPLEEPSTRSKGVASKVNGANPGVSEMVQEDEIFFP